MYSGENGNMELKYVHTTCPYCGTGCGFNIVVKDGRAVGIEPGTGLQLMQESSVKRADTLMSSSIARTDL